MTSPNFLKCAICGHHSKIILQKHHLSYHPEKLVYLCANCHARVTRDATFEKRVREQMERRSFIKNRKSYLEHQLVHDRKRKKLSLHMIADFYGTDLRKNGIN